MREYEKVGGWPGFFLREVFGRSDLSALRVARGPVKEELDWLRPETIPRRFPAFAPRPARIKLIFLLEKKVTIHCVRTDQGEDGSLPVLRPFSQIGGAMTAQDCRPPAAE